MVKNIVTASYIIIGDEILSGRTQDANLNFLANNLSEIGVNLKEVRVVADDEKEIIEAVNILRKKYDYLFTSGGVGPTHDDITSLAIAKAFNVELMQDLDSRNILEEYYKTKNLNEARLKMSLIPKGSRAIKNDIMAVGGFYIENVFVLAGVPKIFRFMFDAIKNNIIGGQKIKSLEIKTSFKESSIAKSLGDLQLKYNSVSIGSYPFEGGTSLVFRSFNYELLEKSFHEMIEILKADNSGLILENT